MRIEAAVEKLVDGALGLSGAELAALAGATRSALGRGPAIWRGSRRSPALQAATAAVTGAGRGSLLERAEVALSEALLGAFVSAATLEGRDVGGIRPAWQELRVAVTSGGVKQRRATFRRFRKAVRAGLGRTVERQWLMAGIGARLAMVAVVSWDLAGAGGGYTVAQRDELVAPWAGVAALPALS